MNNCTPYKRDGGDRQTRMSCSGRGSNSLSLQEVPILKRLVVEQQGPQGIPNGV